MVRGTGKFKQKRGGGRSFSKDLGADDRKTFRGSEGIEEESSEEESSEEEESEGESEEEAPTTSAAAAAQPELTRAERRELKKKNGDKKKPGNAKAGGSGAAGADDEEEEGDDDDDLVNPNHVQKKLNISDLNEPRELSRREREQKEKADAKERYWKLHMQGKTDEAKSDLSRLAKIRAEREAAQAKRKAEAEAKAQEAEQKKQAQLAKRG